MKIVALASANGGTGRTTVAAHLGVLLAQEGHSCLVVDLDPQNALGLSFGMEPGEHFGLARRGLGADELVRYVRRLRTEVPILPFGSIGLEELVTLEEEVVSRPDWLRQRLDAMTRGAFDIVIVDLPAGFGPFSRAGLALADLVVGVLTPDASSYATLPQLQDAIAELCEHRPHFCGLYTLLNRMDARRGLQRDVRAALQNLLQHAAVPVSLPLDEAVREAVAQRRTLFQASPDSAVLAGLREVAGWVVEVLSETPAPTLIQG